MTYLRWLLWLVLTLVGSWATAQPRPLLRPLVLRDTARDYALGPASALLVAPTDSALSLARVQPLT